MYCWVQYSWVVFVFLGVTLDDTETSFAKTPFSWCLKFRDVPAKSRDIPPKRFDFPGFEGAYRTFWSPPLHVEDPHPTGKYPGSKVWVWWETDFYPVRVLGGIVLALGGCQTPAQYWIKIVHPWVHKFYPVLGRQSGERLL